jgi:N-acetylmuramoyl-L-alanine amidase CwlA
MDIYDVATRLREAEGRMRKSITDFEAESARQWALKKEKIDEAYSAEIESFRKEIASKTDAQISALKSSFGESLKKYKSSKAKEYSQKAEQTISEVLQL